MIPLTAHTNQKADAGEPPHCVHGDWTFAGADYKRKATKWRCPTGQCKPASMWIGASRNHPLIHRSTKKYDDLYAKRGSVERAFARLKHEQGLTPIRVRGRARVQLHADLTILAVLTSRLAHDRAHSRLQRNERRVTRHPPAFAAATPFRWCPSRPRCRRR